MKITNPYDKEITNIESVKQNLMEKWAPEFNKKGMKPVTDFDRKKIISVLLENESLYAKENKPKFRQMINEAESSEAGITSKTDAMETFFKILTPMVRRVYANLDAMNLVGVQPVTAPTGFIYALRYMYAGDKFSKAKRPSNPERLSTEKLNFMSYVLVVQDSAGVLETLFNNNALVGRYCGATAVAADFSGHIVYVEKDMRGSNVYYKFLINKDALTPADPTLATIPSTTFTIHANFAFTSPKIAQLIAGGDPGVVAVPDGVTVYNIISDATNGVRATYQNEVGFRFILKNYTGPIGTAAGENMGWDYDEQGLPIPPFKSINMFMERIPVTVVSRKLKVRFTEELYTDMKAIYNTDVENELVNIGEYEIKNEINAWILNSIVNVATLAGQWTFGGAGIVMQNPAAIVNPVATGWADGRYQEEKFKTLISKIRKEAMEIAFNTRSGMGNKLIVTPNILVMLKELGMTPTITNGTITSGLTYVGLFDTFEVYLDTFNFTGEDYVLVGYKGTNELDAGIIYTPYVPLEVKKITDPDTFHTVYGFMTRDGITNNIFGAEHYWRYISVDLTGSSIK